MTQPIWDSRYWKTRLETAYQHEQLHHAIYLRPLEEWKEIEERHKGILAKEIQENTSIIDVGCGYGRLLTLLPDHWMGNYVGVDLSPDFISLAKKTHPGYNFVESTIENLASLPSLQGKKWDVAILISIKQMVIANQGGAVWDNMEKI